MDPHHSTTNASERERQQHLKFEDRVTIKIYRKLGYSLRRIADELNCSPSTVCYELKRGTGTRKGNRGRNPEYSARRGQAVYNANRRNCHRKPKTNGSPRFIEWLTRMVVGAGWSLDSCVGNARRKHLFPMEEIPSTKTLYNDLWAGRLPFTVFDLPEVLGRRPRKHRSRLNKRILGPSIDERPGMAAERIEYGHWEIDTVVGKKAGRESVILTLVEKKSDYYIAIKIPSKDSVSVNAALEALRDEYGEEHFNQVFKTITADNGAEFDKLTEVQNWGTGVYFAHPYSSWERPQNERHNRIFRRFVPKGVSIENYTVDQILSFADAMNDLPRRRLGYFSPADLFDAFLDQVYSLGA